MKHYNLYVKFRQCQLIREENMAVRQTVAVVLLCALGAARVPIQEESLNLRDHGTRHIRSPERDGAITFNGPNDPPANRGRTVGHFPSAPAVPDPVFRPNIHSHRNSFSPRVVYPDTQLWRPHGPPPNGAVVHPSDISFGYRRVTVQSSSNPSVNYVPTKDPARTESEMAFSNKPSVPTRHPTHITDADRHAPILFGVNDVGMTFPGASSSHSNKPSVIQPTVTDFSYSNESPTFDITNLVPDTFPTSNTSPVIFFPGSVNIPGIEINTNDDTNIREDNLDGECDLKHREVFFNGGCSILLYQGSCPDDHWLILSSEGTPYCSERRCPWGLLPFEDQCVDPDDSDICGTGQILYVDFSGHVECDCEPDFTYNVRTKKCYTEHEQGICPKTYYLQRNEGHEMTCVPNPCRRDGYVLHERRCYEKNYLGSCKPELVSITEDGNADCLFIVPHSIFDIPTLEACPPGSRRDSLHKCRTVFRVPSQATTRTLRGMCPPDFIKGPRGRCRRVVSLFG